MHAPVPNWVARDVAPDPVALPAASRVSDELERLFHLKEKGALTEEEHIVQKAKLLA